MILNLYRKTFLLKTIIPRWLIHNGNQILGPFTAQEIASRLFTQELDFDCECWVEGRGDSSQIKNSGIFPGSEDKLASFWVYDEKLIYGPMSPDSIKTALNHGAFSGAVFICEKSTVYGWTPLAKWDFIECSKKESASALHKELQSELIESFTPPQQSVQEQERS